MDPGTPAGPRDWVAAAATAAALAVSVRIAGFIVVSDASSATVLTILAPGLAVLDAVAAGFAVALQLRRRENGTTLAAARAARLAAILGAIAGALAAGAFAALLYAIAGGDTVPGFAAWLFAGMTNGLAAASAAALLPPRGRRAPRLDSDQHALRPRAYGVNEPRNGATP